MFSSHCSSESWVIFTLIVKGWKVVMVSQAASQTRFRATKHENGIAGSATIIVRVIACFQPLQDCQVCIRLFDLVIWLLIMLES